jgi:hypothetical protein
LATQLEKLSSELDRWPPGQATFWWRDDDAVSDSDAMSKLLELSRNYRAPLALAVVPAPAEQSLSEALKNQPQVRVWQHGYAHTNHAPSSAKKAELGDDRPVAAVIEELVIGRDKLHRVIGEAFDPVLVPPWNRIGVAVRAALPAAGFDRLSTFGSRRSQVPPREMNAHADIVDWHGSRGFIGLEAMDMALADLLAARRRGISDQSGPTGILTHHLNHDGDCWDFLEHLLERIERHPAARLVHPDDLHW